MKNILSTGKLILCLMLVSFAHISFLRLIFNVWLLLFFQTEKFLDRKLDKAENHLKGRATKVRKWYAKYIGDEEGPKINDLHIFLTAFLGGIALGVATG